MAGYTKAEAVAFAVVGVLADSPKARKYVKDTLQFVKEGK